MAYLDREGHETHLVFDPAIFSGSRGRDIPFISNWFEVDINRVVGKILELEPDVLAVSCVTGTYRWSVEVARQVRVRRKAPVVFGGIHPTAVPDRVIAESVIDAIVLGEGEGALADLVESAKDSAFRRSDVANTWVKRNGEVIKNSPRPLIENLDTLPFPKKRAYYEKAPVMEINYLAMTSRGCPHKCTYCCNSIYDRIYPGVGNPVRRLSPERVIEELEAARRGGVTRFIEFWDDIFTRDIAWLTRFEPLYRERVGLPFQCYAHPHFMDEKRAKLLARAGCTQVKMGVQSLEQTTLRDVLNRPGSAERVERAIGWLSDEGIRVSVEHLLDVPGEGEVEQARAAKFYNRVRPDKIASFWLVYYPGTQIGFDSRDKGILTDQDIKDIEEGDDRFTYTFMFPGGPLAERRAPLKPFQILFDILPMIPRSWVDWLIKNQNYRRLPYSSILHQLLMLINALRIREREDIQALHYVVSHKNVP